MGDNNGKYKSNPDIKKENNIEHKKTKKKATVLAKKLTIWELIRGICGFASAFLCPVRWAFYERAGFHAINYLEYIFDVFFVIDFILRFGNISLISAYKSITSHAGNDFQPEIQLKTLTLLEIIYLIVAHLNREIPIQVLNHPREFLYTCLATFPWELFGPQLIWTLLSLCKYLRFRHTLHSITLLQTNINVNYFAAVVASIVILLTMVGHWGGCIFYALAAVNDFDEDTWIGTFTCDNDSKNCLNESDNVLEKYLMSMSWAYTTISTVGYGDLYPVSYIERFYAIIFMLINIAITQATTAKMTVLFKHDQIITKFRDELISLQDYLNENNIPKDVQQKMIEYKRLKYENSREDELAQFPTAIKLQIIIAKFASLTQQVDIFQGLSPTFHKNLLTGMHEELFLDGMAILRSGDVVKQLFILVKGSCEVVTENPDTGEEDIIAVLGEGTIFGCEGFFTNILQPWTVRTVEVCKAIAISTADRLTWETTYPRDYRLMLQNVNEEMVRWTKFLLKNYRKNAKEKKKQEDEDKDILMNVINEVHSDIESVTNTNKSGTTFKISPTDIETNAPKLAPIVNSKEKRKTAIYNTLKHQSDMDQKSGKLLFTDYQDLKESDSDSDDDVTGTLFNDTMSINSNHVEYTTDNYIKEKCREIIHSFKESLNKQVADLSAYLCDRALYGDLSAIKRTLALYKGCGILENNLADYDGRTPQHLAATKHYLDILKLLHKADLPINPIDVFGNTPLSEAATKGAPEEVVEYLVRHGGTIEFPDIGGIMCNYVLKGDTQVVSNLLVAGADPDACDYDNRTALHIASCEGNLLLVKMFIEQGADIEFQDRWGSTALTEAVQNGHPHLVKFLLSRGADPNHKNNLGISIFMEAFNHSDDCMKLITEAGADPGIKDTGIELCTIVYKDDKKKLQKFLQSGVNPNCFGYDNRTPLHIACSLGRFDMVNALMQAGADPLFRDRMGNSCIQDATKFEHHSIVDFIKAFQSERTKNQKG